MNWQFAGTSLVLIASVLSLCLACRSQPNKTEPWKAALHRGIDLAYQGNHERAISFYTKAIEANPASAQAYHERAMSRIELDHDDAAIEDFSRALELQPYFPGALSWRAYTYMKYKRYKKAAADRLAKLRHAPEGNTDGMGVSPDEWTECAKSLMLAGETNEAVKLLEDYYAKGYADRITAYRSDSSSPPRMLSRLYLSLDQFEKAVRYGKIAYDDPNRVPRDFEDYALALEAAGNFALALKIAEEGLAQNDQMEGLLGIKQRRTP